MPNTPALIGKGITALYARPAVAKADQTQVEQVIATTGEWLWVADEAHLDAVTALSGSGPAYVFFFLEAMTEAGMNMGLSRQQAYRLSVATFAGAAELARASDDPPEVLRQRVTSKGGTTDAAIRSLEGDGVSALFVKALQAARERARGIGRRVRPLSYRMAYPATTPAKTVNPSQWFRRKALKQPSRSRLRISR